MAAIGIGHAANEFGVLGLAELCEGLIEDVAAVAVVEGGGHGCDGPRDVAAEAVLEGGGDESVAADGVLALEIERVIEVEDDGAVRGHRHSKSHCSQSSGTHRVFSGQRWRSV